MIVAFLQRYSAALSIALRNSSAAFGLDDDGTFAADSDARVPTQAAVKDYVDAAVAAAGGGDNWAKKTANYTAVHKDAILADTSGGTWTFQFPAAPTALDRASVYAFGANDLTLDRNGSNIMSAAANWTFKNGDGARFVYMDASNGWVPTGRQYG